MHDRQWVAGLLEGEGSFQAGPPSAPNLPILSCSMTDKDVLERLAKCLGGIAICRVSRQQPHHRPAFVLQLRGSRAIEAMKILRPLMGERRKLQIDKAIQSHTPFEPGKTTPAQREEAVRRLNAGESAKSLGLEFGVTHWAIYRMRDKQRKLHTAC